MADKTPPDDAALAHADQAVAARPWQFSLRAMMAFTAAVAGVVWLATIKGAGVLVVVAGLTVSMLNWRGALAGWQRPERCGRPIKLGWLLLAISLVLPSVQGCNEQVLGWEVAWVCASTEIEVIRNGITNGFDTDDSKGALKDMLEVVFMTLINLTNLLLFALPWFLVLLRRGRGQCYAAILSCGATAAWTAPVPDAGGLLVGYYVWCLGQLMVLSAARLGPRTLAAMMLVAFVRVFLWPEP
ncbi:MAG TPA: hypothetical protein VND64_24740 [Pirellulales bacterium]|nr:hypothetical protein [Pirellulales bacterium]